MVAKGQTSVIGIAFFIVFLFISFISLISVVSRLERLVSNVKVEEVEEGLEVRVSDYYLVTSSYAQSLNLIKGTYVSGTLSSLNEVDEDYYVIEGPPIGVGGMWQELVKNGDFEDGLTYWGVDASYNAWITTVEYGTTETEYGQSAYVHVIERSRWFGDHVLVTFYQSFTVSGSVDQAQLTFIFKVDFIASGAQVYVRIYIDDDLVNTYGPYTSDLNWYSVSEDVAEYLTAGTHTLKIIFEFITGRLARPNVYAYLDNVSLRALVQTVAGLSEIIFTVSFSPPENFGLVLNMSGYFDMDDPVEVQVVEDNSVSAKFVFMANEFSLNTSVASAELTIRMLSVSQFTVHIDLLRLEAKVPKPSFNVTIKCLSEYSYVLRVWYKHQYVEVNKVLGYGDEVTVTINQSLDLSEMIKVITRNKVHKFCIKL